MNGLSKVFIAKIVATILFWCAPLILLPPAALEALGFPRQDTFLFMRLLGWAYLSLCVGYYHGLLASLKGKRSMGPIYVGIVSNGGASALLLWYGTSGGWSDWGAFVQFSMWTSALATALITAGLFIHGVQGTEAKED